MELARNALALFQHSGKHGFILLRRLRFQVGRRFHIGSIIYVIVRYFGGNCMPNLSLLVSSCLGAISPSVGWWRGLVGVVRSAHVAPAADATRRHLRDC